MFLSPLNWHYAKFTSFEWKFADCEVQMPGAGQAPVADPEQKAGSAPGIAEGFEVDER
jgi:hypothetical protein